MEQNEVIFGVLPDPVFGPLASPNRKFYSELLEYLLGSVFDDTSLLKKSAVIDDIQIYMDIHNVSLLDEVDDLDFSSLRKSQKRKGTRSTDVYNRLFLSGWFIEQKDRYRTVVDLHPDARLLLGQLIEIKDGKLRSYGGAVLQVLNSLEAAFNHPESRSEGITEATKFSKSFMQHLRTLKATLGQVEEELRNKENLSDMFSLFVDNYISKFLIEDYDRLQGRDNPFRFRSNIRDLCWEIYQTPSMINTLSKAYVREGRAATNESAKVKIEGEIDLILRTFNSVDDFMSLIDTTKCRIEQRIKTTVRFLDQISSLNSEGLIETIKLLADYQDPENLEDPEINIQSTLITGQLPWGSSKLYKHKTSAQPATRKSIKKKIIDPAYKRFLKAKEAYEISHQITWKDINQYLEKSLGDKEKMEAKELPLNSLEEFFIFDELIPAFHLKNDDKNKPLLLELIPGEFSSEWVTSPNFIIKRNSTQDNINA